ncbi:uncharacterized protein LOC121382815 [Gigantopelta aegis]|uniref:uncharacterized protein LOC121382815 n=1 Tax=Gigantopelta aegis TaxID=1735272 RepID=UPI001B88BAE5|nr:uncharacterized protein LOC121382815 [Gigantopelta aegis]
MDKQYSVQFFTSFVEAMQKFCREYIDFEQCVELSGYLAVEIDNHKKERYVLSEMLQSSGNVISESYCTKAFKTLRKEPSVCEKDGENRSPNHYRTVSRKTSLQSTGLSVDLTGSTEERFQGFQCSNLNRRRQNFVHSTQRMRRSAALNCRPALSHSLIAPHRMSVSQINERTGDQISSRSPNSVPGIPKRGITDGSCSPAPTVKKDKLDCALNNLVKAADDIVKQSELCADLDDSTVLTESVDVAGGVRVKKESETDVPYMVIDNPLGDVCHLTVIDNPLDDACHLMTDSDNSPANPGTLDTATSGKLAFDSPAVLHSERQHGGSNPDGGFQSVQNSSHDSQESSVSPSHWQPSTEGRLHVGTCTDITADSQQRRPSDERFQCQQCGKTFTYNSALVRHNRNVHLGSLRFLCTICGRTLSRKDYFMLSLASTSSTWTVCPGLRLIISG